MLNIYKYKLLSDLPYEGQALLKLCISIFETLTYKFQADTMRNLLKHEISCYVMQVYRLHGFIFHA